MIDSSVTVKASLGNSEIPISWVQWPRSNSRFNVVDVGNISNTCFVYIKQVKEGFFTNMQTLARVLQSQGKSIDNVKWEQHTVVYNGHRFPALDLIHNGIVDVFIPPYKIYEMFEEHTLDT